MRKSYEASVGWVKQTSRIHQATSSPLLERDRELEALRGALARAAGGSGSLVIVEGPAGIGKTRLLRETAILAERSGLLVRNARGGEMERDLPFGIARQLLETLVARASEEEKEALLSGSARQALAALGDLEHQGVPLDSFAPINGLYWLVANLSERQPAVLVIDDAHWADVESLRCITFLARRLSDLPVLVIVGIRSGEPTEPQELAPLRLEAERLQPRSLSPRSVHELIAATVGHEPSEHFSNSCASATAGNPFLLSEVLRELLSEGLELDDEAAISISKLAPENVATSVLFRLGRFGGEAIALTRAIAVLGRAPQIRQVAELAGVGEVRASQLCDELRKAEVLAAGFPIDFVHPLIRQVIFNEVPEGERSAMHRRAAEMLDRSGAEPVDVALHLLECAPDSDQWVVTKLQQAARVALRRGAFDSAVTFLERALEEPPEDELRILSRLGAAWINSEPHRASDVLTDVVNRAEDEQTRIYALGFLIVANQYASRLGEVARACGALSEVLGHTDQDVVLALEAQRYVFWRWAEGVAETSKARIDFLARTVDTETVGGRLIRQAAAWESFCSCAPVDQVTELALPIPEPPWVLANIPTHSSVPIFGVLALACSGRWGDARKAMQQWRQYVETSEGGWASGLSMANATLAEIDRMNGRLHEAESNATTALEIARAVAPSSAFGWYALSNLAMTLLARGEVAAFESLTAGVDLSVGAEWGPGTWPLLVRALGYLARGEIEKGVEDLLSLGEGLEQIAWMNPAYPPWRQEATEALAALGRTREAEELVVIAEERARTFGGPHVIGGVLRARASVEPANKAMDTLMDSVQLLERSGPPHELARSLIDLGNVLNRSGQRREAREPLRRGLELAHRTGAGGLERRAQDELAATGSRPRRISVTGVEALTATERRVAELAAEGLTNKEIAERLFVTTRTIETHLTHIYEKLSIGGRRHLARALTAQEP